MRKLLKKWCRVENKKSGSPSELPSQEGREKLMKFLRQK